VAIIKVENLSKKYIIGHDRRSSGAYNYSSLRDSIAHSCRGVYQRLRHPMSPNRENTDLEEFWALKDINFEINAGDKVGIIGRNGAGKSTLLKILSRITEPTTGKITMNGRVASLLEVGTGFHPELTGRENIYLNGSILGMTRSEIKKKFDEIVDFSGVEKFLDTPVKRYSSGMYVRLAFAVAAHLEPEILLIDEVLAVGDAEFQKKCLGKMDEVSKQGRTILFVSHNMVAIKQLCNKSMFLQNGKNAFFSNSQETINFYLKSNQKIKSSDFLEQMLRTMNHNKVFKFDNIKLWQNGNIVKQDIENGKPLEIQVSYEVFEKTTGLRIFFDLLDNLENILFRSFNDEANDGIPIVLPGKYVSKAIIPADLLAPLQYQIRIYSTIYNVKTLNPDGITICINVERTGKSNKAYLMEPIRGKLAPAIPWQTKRI